MKIYRSDERTAGIGEPSSESTPAEFADELERLQRDLGLDSTGLSDAVREAAPDPVKDCPSAEDLAVLVGEPDDDVGAVGPRLTAAQRGALADHLAHCEHCRAATLVAANAVDSLMDPKPLETIVFKSTEDRSAPGWSALQWLSAASLVLALGATGWWTATRSTVVPSLERDLGEAIVVPEEKSVLDQVPAEFVWPAQVGATSYRVVVFTESAERLWQSGATTNPQWTADELPDLNDGHYVWEVHVEGRVPQTVLGPYWFELRRQ